MVMFVIPLYILFAVAEALLKAAATTKSDR